MRRFRSSGRLALSLVVASVVFPAAAWAGKKVISGQQSLQIKVTVHPARAGAHGVTLHVHVVYLNTKAPSQQPPYNTKSSTFVEPKGLALRTSAVPACQESKIVAANGDAPKACPAGAQVGHGAVVVNARPTIKSLITGTVTAYNGVDDAGYAGFKKGSPLLALYIKTSIGITTVDYFHIVKSSRGLTLISRSTKPAAPGIAPGVFTIRQLDLTIAGSGKHPYMTAPPSCTGSWPFSLTITNWFGQPSVTAGDRVACKP